MSEKRDPKVINLSIRLKPRTARLLEVLASSDAVGTRRDVALLHERVADVVYHLAMSAAEGVCRPGAWERAWVEQAFGGGWQQRLEADPQATWRQRPIAPAETADDQEVPTVSHDPLNALCNCLLCQRTELRRPS
jgi:hypothetical protein